MDGVLHCNYRRCQAPLSNTAWMAICSHVFCEEHASTFISEDRKCPLCSTELNGGYDLIQLALDVPYEDRMMSLAGLNPKTILDIGNKAISFWKFQVFHEKLHLLGTIKSLRVRLAQSESSLHMSNNINSEIQKQAKKCSILEKELEEHKMKIQELEKKIEFKNRMMYTLHMKTEVQKKQLMSQQQQPLAFPQEEIIRQVRPARSRISPSFMVRNNHQGFTSSQEMPNRSTSRFPSSSQH